MTSDATIQSPGRKSGARPPATPKLIMLRQPASKARRSVSPISGPRQITRTPGPAAMPVGTRRLLRLTVAAPVRAVERRLSPRARLVLAGNPDGSVSDLINDCADAATDSITRDRP